MIDIIEEQDYRQHIRATANHFEVRLRRNRYDLRLPSYPGA